MNTENDKPLDKQEVYKALYKKAVGYSTMESVEEYIKSADDELILSKKKVTSKDVPPDITALKVMLSLTDYDYVKMSDEELETEKIRLLSLLEELNKD